MKNGLSTLQKYFRVQRVVAILFFLIMVVSLLLPYAKVDVSTLYLPVVFRNSTNYGHELGLALTAVVLALICALLVILTKNRILSIVTFFLALLILIMLIFLPEEIRFNRIFVKPQRTDYNYSTGFYMMMIGGIGIIITALINLIVVTKKTPREHSVNPDLIDDLE